MSTFKRCDECNGEKYIYPCVEWIEVNNKMGTVLPGEGTVPPTPFPSISGDYCSLLCLRDRISEVMQRAVELKGLRR